MQEITFHSKPVRDFAFCIPYSLFASCSERTIALWQAQTGKLAGRLSGHMAPVAALAMDNECAFWLSRHASNMQMHSASSDGCLCAKMLLHSEW